MENKTHNNRFVFFYLRIAFLIAMLSFSSFSFSQTKYIVLAGGPSCSADEYTTSSESFSINGQDFLGQSPVIDFVPTSVYYSHSTQYQEGTYSGQSFCVSNIGGNVSNPHCYFSSDALSSITITSNEVIIAPISTDNIRCDVTTLKAEGCTGTQKFYWEYSLDGVNFTPFGTYTSYNQEISFSGAQYLGTNYRGNVYFRCKIDSLDGGVYYHYTLDDVYSNIVTYNYVPCSPHLNGAPALVQNQCSNSNAGSATFTFNRALAAGEYFNMTLFQENGINDIPVGSKPITQSQFANQQFSWPALGAGTYYLRYQTFLDNNPNDPTSDANSPAFTITAPPAVTFNKTSQNVLCGGAATGSITVNASGGNGTYQYSKDNGAHWQSNALFSGLTAGTYSILVKDTNNCIAPSGAQSVTLTHSTPTITFGNVEINSPSVIGGNDGNIAVTVGGGTAPFTYHWTNSSNLSVGTNSNSLTGLTAGTYTLNLSDTNNCPKSESFTVTEFTATITEIAEVDCLGGSIGKLKAEITGGKPPYEYEWVGKNDFDDQLDTIPEGNYTLKVMDYNGLIRETTYVLEPHLPTATAIPTAVLCKGLPTGSIDITATSGKPPYTYNWVNTNAPTVALTTTEDPTGLVAGNYSCTITDAHSCTFTLNTSITEPSLALTIADPPAITLVTLIGASTGGIDITVNGGTAAYTYLWSTGETTPGISNKPAGNYTVTVTDANQCSTTASYTLEDPPPLVVTVSVTQPILCNKAENGILQANVSGGRPPYTYEWKKDTELITSSTPQINHLSPGNYEVKVTDKYGATLSSSIWNLTEPEPLSATPHITPINCYGQANGAIDLNASGGTPPYTYAWNTGASTAFLTNLAVGNYVVEITDAYACRELITGIHVNSTSNIVIHENTKNPSCYGDCDGEISIDITGGSGNYNIVWDAPTMNGWHATQLCKGNYSAMVTDITDNCMIPLNFTITEPAPLTLDLGTDQTVCYGQQLTIGEDRRVNDYQYQWTSNTGFSAATPQVAVSESGTYELLITTPKGCTVKDAIRINRLDQPAPSEFLVVSQTYKNEDIILINLTQQSNQTYNWIVPDQAIIQSETPNTLVIRFTEMGNYTVRLKTTNTTDGCQFFIDKQIVVEENPGLSADAAATSLIQEFKIYPNPAPSNSSFNTKIVLNQEAPLSLTIYDMALGKLINETNLPTAKDHLQEFNLNLTAGVYWIILRTSNTVQAKKLIVN